ncbi:hypothetical protein ACFYOT_14180 [Saccharothrix saharensis]|uniref:hypothetical protein n=1 Tax=Saccharothrix saharensis TaxID=571190 RepID=UPI0036751351
MVAVGGCLDSQGARQIGHHDLGCPSTEGRLDDNAVQQCLATAVDRDGPTWRGGFQIGWRLHPGGGQHINLFPIGSEVPMRRLGRAVLSDLVTQLPQYRYGLFQRRWLDLDVEQHIDVTGHPARSSPPDCAVQVDHDAADHDVLGR